VNTQRLTEAERRLMDEAQADMDGGMRLAAYCVLCAAMVVAGVLVVAAAALLR